MNFKYIALEGNIGAGKTTVSKMLAERFSAKLILEEFADNPFLPSFYEDREKWAFPLEMSFLAERYQQAFDNFPSPDLFADVAVSDYMIWKSLVFARINLKPIEFELYQKFFRIMFERFPRPDIIVYLNKSTDKLIENIQKRGREYEQQISPEYLQSVHQSYLSFFKQLSGFPVLMVNTNEIDFLQNPENLDSLIALVNRDYDKGLHYLNLDELSV